METIIMTVGTSLLKNTDKDSENKRPWLDQKSIGDPQRALASMTSTEMALIRAETNTYWRLAPTPQDVLILLHSDTSSGLRCVQILKLYFEQELGQQVRVSTTPLMHRDPRWSEWLISSKTWWTMPKVVLPLLPLAGSKPRP